MKEAYTIIPENRERYLVAVFPGRARLKGQTLEEFNQSAKADGRVPWAVRSHPVIGWKVGPGLGVDDTRGLPVVYGTVVSPDRLRQCFIHSPGAFAEAHYSGSSGTYTQAVDWAIQGAWSRLPERG